MTPRNNASENYDEIFVFRGLSQRLKKGQFLACTQLKIVSSKKPLKNQTLKNVQQKSQTYEMWPTGLRCVWCGSCLVLARPTSHWGTMTRCHRSRGSVHHVYFACGCLRQERVVGSFGACLTSRRTRCKSMTSPTISSRRRSGWIAFECSAIVSSSRLLPVNKRPETCCFSWSKLAVCSNAWVKRSVFSSAKSMLLLVITMTWDVSSILHFAASLHATTESLVFVHKRV